VEIYLHTKFRWDSSIHGWDITTSGFGKRTAAILEFYFRFQFRSMYSHWHTILHLHAKCSNRMSVSGVMTSYPFFSEMAAGSHIGFDVGNVGPPAKRICQYQLGPQIWSWSDLSTSRFGPPTMVVCLFLAYGNNNLRWGNAASHKLEVGNGVPLRPITLWPRAFSLHINSQNFPFISLPTM